MACTVFRVKMPVKGEETPRPVALVVVSAIHCPRPMPVPVVASKHPIISACSPELLLFAGTRGVHVRQSRPPPGNSLPSTGAQVASLAHFGELFFSASIENELPYIVITT